MAITPKTKCRKFQGLCSNVTPEAVDCGSGMVTKAMIRNVTANTAMATHSSGVTSFILVLSVTSPISTPTKNGVNVAVSELSVPPVWMSWFPRLPPPPNRFNIGFTTVFNIQTQKPQMKAPIK